MQTETNPVEATRVREHMRKLLDQVPVKTACAVGVQNLFSGNHLLENPRWFLLTGKLFSEAPGHIEQNMAGIICFGKVEYSMRGTSGLFSYDISGTEYMVCIHFMIPFSETLFDNRYFVCILPQQELCENLYTELNSKSKKPDEEIEQQEHGIMIRGFMTKDSKAMVMLECRENKDLPEYVVREEDKPVQSYPVGTGEPLRQKLREWMNDTSVRCACAVGVNNFSGFKLSNPIVYTETGMCKYQPPTETEMQMAAPAFFTKSPYSLRGTAGVFTYNIGDDFKYKLAIMWSVPLTELISNNVFNVHIISNSVDCNHALFSKLKAGAHPAKEGSTRHTEDSFVIEAQMDSECRSSLVINLSKRDK